MEELTDLCKTQNAQRNYKSVRKYLTAPLIPHTVPSARYVIPT